MSCAFKDCGHLAAFADVMFFLIIFSKLLNAWINNNKSMDIRCVKVIFLISFI